MSDSIIVGTIYTRGGGPQTMFSGTFSVSIGIPYYIQCTDSKPNPIFAVNQIIKISQLYEGWLFLYESPCLGIPIEQKAKFSFVNNFVGVKLKKSLIMTANIALIKLQHTLGTFTLIPKETVLAIQYDVLI